MANVMFKQGSQAALNNYLSGSGNALSGKAIEGAFYLTSDTHRLYIGHKSGDNVYPVPVNEGILSVASVSALPTANPIAGEFYYATEENVLCVYNGNQWVQINPDTNIYLDKINYSISVNNGKATITTTGTMNNGDAPADSYTITGAGGVSVSASGKDITLTGEEYTLSSSVADKVATIKLGSSVGASNDSSVTIKGGSHVTVGKDGNDLTISADYNKVENVAVAAATGSNTGFTVTVTDNGTDTHTGSIDPVIAVGEHPENTDNQAKFSVDDQGKFSGGIATLPVYSKADIDAKLIGLNAMQFKGVATKDPGTTNISIGDTYKVGSTFDLSNYKDGITRENVSVAVGDLIIAIAGDGSAEDTEGHIEASKVKWEVIQSGDESVLTYEFEGTTHGIQLKQNTGDYKGKFELEAGSNNKITLTDSGSNGDKKVTIEHAVATVTTATGNKATNTSLEVTNPATNTTAATNTFEAITAIGYDTTGHISSIGSTKFTIKDTDNGTLDSAELTISDTAELTDTAAATATLTNAIKAKYINNDDGPSVESKVKITSKSLNIKTTSAANQIPEVAFDLVWGSF